MSTPSTLLPPPIQTSLSLLTLPYDIHHLLLTVYLSSPSPSPYLTLRSLRSTCRYFALYIPARWLRRVRRRAVRALARQEAEDWGVWFRAGGPGGDGRVGGVASWANGGERGQMGYFPLYLACFVCAEWVPRWGFVESMTRYRRAPTCSLSQSRWCKPCGSQRPGLAKPGVWYRSSSLDQRDRNHQTPDPSTIALRGDLACMICRRFDRPLDLLWGCRDCFRKEKARRRELELLQASAGRRVPRVVAEWLSRRGMLDERGRMREKDKIGAKEGKKAAVGSFGTGSDATTTPMPRRETRCKDCWCFPVRRKGVKAEAVYESLALNFWCEPCQGLRHRALQKGEKVRHTTSVG